MKYHVGDIVRLTNTYWYGTLHEPREDIGKLYLIVEAQLDSSKHGAYSIQELEGKKSRSSWWHDDQLEMVKPIKYSIEEVLNAERRTTEKHS